MILHDERQAYSDGLTEKDRRTLAEGSAIGHREIAESGARSIGRGRDLPKGFSERQRRRAPGILFPLQRPNGETSYSFRPHRVDPAKPGHKYEQPCKALGGAGNVLGVQDSQRHLIADTSVPVIFTEGVKKQLSLITAARAAGAKLLVVAISGVWNWMASGEPIPDLADIPVDGRKVAISNDSDLLRNPSVQDATRGLAEYQKERGAEVYVTFFADQDDDSKTGADDFFAAGGTLAELWMLTRRYDPGDFTRVRLTRDERLAATITDLWHRYEEMPAARTGECSDRATMRVVIPHGAQSGKLMDGGLKVRLPLRPLCKKTRLSIRAQAKSLQRMERNGYLVRLEEPKHKTDAKGAAYLLKAYTRGLDSAEGKHYERGGAEREEGREQKTLRYADLYAGVYPARYPDAMPELRHSKCVHTWGRREGRRVVVDTEYVFRLAKQRQEIVMYLLEHDGEATEAELLGRFGSRTTRPWDFRRRRIAPLTGWRYSRDKETGQERRLEVGPPLVACEDGTVRLLPEWREALEEHRRATDELADNRRQEAKMDAASKAWRERDRRPADEQPSPLRGKEAMRETLRDAEERGHAARIEEQRRKVGMTAEVFLADALQDASGFGWRELRALWVAKGGDREGLRRAVRSPYRFRREFEGGPLYVERIGATPDPEREPAPVAVLREEVPAEAPAEDWHNHPLDCECVECLAPMPLKYVRLWGAGR